MGWFGRMRRRLAALLRKPELDRWMDDEMAFHLEMEARELERAGHSPAEARRQARLRFGGVDRWREEGRAARGATLLDELVQDVRYAARGVMRRPAFSMAVIATLAVGIGATTAVWSLVDGVVLRPLPFPEPDRLVRVQASWEGEPLAALSPAEYLDYRRGTTEVFSALGGYARGSTTVAGGDGGSAERVPVAFVAADLFAALGTEPLAGRPFTEEEELSGELRLVVSEAFARQRFGEPGSAVGATLRLGSSPYTVVGVMPASFRLPEHMVEGTRPSLFLPLAIDPDTTYQRGSHFLQAAARLAPGVALARAAEAVEGVTARFVAEYPEDYDDEMNFRATAIPLREAVVGEVRGALGVALASVLLVLLIGAANVAALLLARGEARRSEIALRSTLGARRPRLVRQLLVETLVLGLIGGGLGMLLAWGAVAGLVALDPAGIPRLDEVTVDGRVLLFAATLSVACGLLFGLLPALRSAPAAPAAALREDSRRTAGGGTRRLRQALVVGEVALALALLTTAGLLGRTMGELMEVDTGLEIRNVVSTEFTVPSSRYGDETAVRDFVARATAAVRGLPEVEAAGAVTELPLATGIGDLGVEIPGRDIPGDGNLEVDWQAATPGYERAAGLRLLAGRWIDETDRADGLGAVVINRTFAERWWPDGDAIGATVRMASDAEPAQARIVGVVEDVKHEGPASPARLQMYIPHTQFMFWHGYGPARSMTMVARTRPGAATAPASIRRALGELDPAIGLGPFLTLEEAYRDVLTRPRMLATLTGAFAGIALLLAAIGVYGVIAYGVGRRRREFGIRVALGARRSTVAGNVIGEGVALAGVGIALGAVAALLLAGALRSLLFGVSATDPWVLAGGAATLAAAAVLASWLPARRALDIDPAEALRAE